MFSLLFQIFQGFPGLSSLASECIWFPSSDSESALSPVPSNVLLSVLLLGLCQCLCSAISVLVSLALVFPNLTHFQLAKSFLDLQGAKSPQYVCTLSAGTITAGFLSTFGSWLFNKGRASDMSCLSVCQHPLVTLVQLAKGNFPLPQVITLGQVLGLLRGAAAMGCWSVSVSWSELMS